jgi:hypothetical protein
MPKFLDSDWSLSRTRCGAGMTVVLDAPDKPGNDKSQNNNIKLASSEGERFNHPR